MTDTQALPTAAECREYAASRPPRTFVLARDKPTTVAWCRANGIQPFARSTYILGRDSTCGNMLRDVDRLVFVGDVEQRHGYEYTLARIMPTLFHVGGPDKIERVPETAT